MVRDTTNGGGPWQFTIDSALSPNDPYLLDFRNMEFNKTKGYFKKWLPLDVAQITNQSPDHALRVTYNGIYESTVVPNAVETYGDQGITSIEVVNIGSADIAADNVTIEVKKEPYDADKAARERKNAPPLVNVANDLIPGGVF